MSNYRLLLNAEPFGFGPAASVAYIAPLLKAQGIDIAYIGEKHTLDLQNDLPYEAIYDTTNMSLAARESLLQELSGVYPLFFTAMDFAMAESAQKIGMQTIIYDALTWFWSTIHPAIKNSDLYIAQRFFGVEERFSREHRAFPRHCQTVAPIVSARTHRRRRYVLLNMGGLQNPLWDFKDTVLYASIITNAFKAAVPAQQSLITTSASVAQALNEPAVKTLSRQEMNDVLAKTQHAIMTPGLGNMYDAAAFDIPTLWLPPANDSQGQQVQLLAKNGCIDEYLDWNKFSDSINYTAMQKNVLQNITKALRAVSGSDMLQRELSNIMAKKIKSLATHRSSKTRQLLQLFGTDGASELCSAIVNFIEGSYHASAK
jgi:hypothetical protein